MSIGIPAMGVVLMIRPLLTVGCVSVPVTLSGWLPSRPVAAGGVSVRRGASVRLPEPNGLLSAAMIRHGYRNYRSLAKALAEMQSKLPGKKRCSVFHIQTRLSSIDRSADGFSWWTVGKGNHVYGVTQCLFRAIPELTDYFATTGQAHAIKRRLAYVRRQIDFFRREEGRLSEEFDRLTVGYRPKRS